MTGLAAIGGPISEVSRDALRGGGIVQSVPPGAAVVGIVGCIGRSYHMIVAGVAIDRVAACSVRQYVVAFTSQQRVVAGGRGYHVVPGTAGEIIVAIAAIEHVVAGIALKGIVAGARLAGYPLPSRPK